MTRRLKVDQLFKTIFHVFSGDMDRILKRFYFFQSFVYIHSVVEQKMYNL